MDDKEKKLKRLRFLYLILNELELWIEDAKKEIAEIEAVEDIKSCNKPMGRTK